MAYSTDTQNRHSAVAQLGLKAGEEVVINGAMRKVKKIMPDGMVRFTGSRSLVDPCDLTAVG